MELFTPTQLRAMADPEWLIERLFPTGGLVELYGAPGSGKSWIALDWAFHIALGMPWQGLRTKQALSCTLPLRVVGGSARVWTPG